MNVDGGVKILDATTRLLSTLVWPAITGYILFHYESSIKIFFNAISEIVLKFPGGEASFKRSQAEATDALVTAVASRPGARDDPVLTEVNTKAARAAVAAVSPRVIKKASKVKVLWVDDRPANNVYEKRSMESIGISFVTALTTTDALNIMQHNTFDLVISDMGRPPDSRAGYTLLSKMRDSGIETPFVIYAGERTPEFIAEARELGALGCTNRPDELFEYVVSVIRDRS